jgi:hypothetical protein
MPTKPSLPTGGPASIFDRADGSTSVLGGVSEAAGSMKINTADGNTPSQGIANTGPFVQFWYEMSDSPTIESGEQSTIVHKFNTDYNTAVTFMIANPRGTYMTDSQGNTSRVLSTQITPVPRTGMRGVIFTVTSEGCQPLFPNPPDEFDIETVELNPALEKHPRYSDLTYQMRYVVRNADIVDNLNLGQQYKNIVNTITSSLGGTPLQQKEAQELLFKKHKGEDSFYLAGYKIAYSQYFWFPQILNPGGYIEDPVSGGGLPFYYWSDTGKVDGTNIFSETATHNTNLYPPFLDTPLDEPPYGLSWLRQADTMHLNRTWYKVTKTWIGGPIGQFDNELYNRNIQPYQISENSGSILLG